MRKKELVEEVWVLKSKVIELERVSSWLDDDIKELRKEIKQLKCEHKNIKFVNKSPVGNPMSWRDVKQCKDCDKILKLYTNELEFKQDQINYYRNKANEIELGD